MVKGEVVDSLVTLSGLKTWLLTLLAVNFASKSQL